MNAAPSFWSGRHASDACRARPLHRKLSTDDHWWAPPARVPRARVHAFQDVFGPAEMSPARPIVRYSSSCAASSSILLIALVRRILLDVPLMTLLIEVF